MVQYLAVFFAMAILDFVWAKYNVATTQHRPFASANYSVLIFALGGFSILSYTTDPAMLIPGTLGAWIGTFLAVKTGAE